MNARAIGKYRPRLVTGGGSWWGLVEDDAARGGRLWARLGKIEMPVKDALGCYRLARYFFAAGILSKVCSTAVREDGVRATQVDLKGETVSVAPVNQPALDQIVTRDSKEVG